jgi:hypothetical protein
MDMDSYDVLLSLDFLIKIGTIVDVERNLIQTLPLIMVNMLQRMNSETLMRDVVAILENAHLNGDSDMAIGNPSLCDPIMAEQMDALVLDSNTNTDDDCDERPQLVEPNSDEPEFGNTEFENLVLLEGP